MTITIEYVAQMRRVAGVADETVDVPDGTTAQQVITQVAKAHGGELETLLLDDQVALRPSALAFVADEQIEWGTATSLRDGDKVTLLAPLAGG